MGDGRQVINTRCAEMTSGAISKNCGANTERNTGATLRQKAWGQVSKCAICGPIERPTESGGGGWGRGGARVIAGQ